jgi:hypothetical protein
LQISTSDAKTAQCSAPPSEPARKRFAVARSGGLSVDDVAVDLDAALVEELREGFPV